MCSISVNRTANEQLNDLARSDDKSMIEKRLFEFAKVANKKQDGPLDAPKNRMKRMPDDLRHVRKQKVGRHRVFYTGYHTQCSYQVFFIKKFKRTGKDREGSSNFQNKLRSALSESIIREIASST